MSKKTSNINKNFMVFNAVLFIAVVAICFVFLYLSYALKRKADRVVTYEGNYRIELSADLKGDSLSVYINDSLLMSRTIPDSLITLDIRRFAEESTLIVVDNRTDAVTPFNLNKEGSKLTIRKEQGETIIEELPL